MRGSVSHQLGVLNKTPQTNLDLRYNSISKDSWCGENLLRVLKSVVCLFLMSVMKKILPNIKKVIIGLHVFPLAFIVIGFCDNRRALLTHLNGRRVLS